MYCVSISSNGNIIYVKTKCTVYGNIIYVKTKCTVYLYQVMVILLM
jgi:hypothetical protein